MAITRLSAVGALLFLVTASHLHATGVSMSAIPLYNTGIAGPGGTDLHYDIVPCPDCAATGPAMVLDPDGGPVTWAATDPSFGWIALEANYHWEQPGYDINDPVGWYDFRTTFDLTGFVASSVGISGSWAADNYGYILLNGNPTGVSLGTNIWSFLTLHSFQITTGFQPGLNTLDFMVYNAAAGPLACGDPVGLAADMTGEGVLVPEPASLGLCGLAFIAAFAYLRKRRI